MEPAVDVQLKNATMRPTHVTTWTNQKQIATSASGKGTDGHSACDTVQKFFFLFGFPIKTHLLNGT